MALWASDVVALERRRCTKNGSEKDLKANQSSYCGLWEAVGVVRTRGFGMWSLILIPVNCGITIN